ncbi:MAG TPA: GNAT family N-acetyltransferase [Nocardioides sp.]|nr:GNAT family N-acetyltransferase [Nocardioides sp.]
MDVRSLAYRTDLALLAASGSDIEHHDDHVVVRTPANPTYWWGNFLLLDRPPAADDVPRWMALTAAAHPGSAHVAFGVDGTDGTVADLQPFAAAGLDVEAATVMTATAVHEPPRPNREATYRPLRSDEDWEQQVALGIAGEHEESGADFVVAKAAAERAMTGRGQGEWWGAFLGGTLVASMGLFVASPGLARFQNVKTHPDARGRGLAGTLVHEVSRFGFEELGVETLVMVADPDYLAIRVYRSVGFADTETQLQASRKPA